MAKFVIECPRCGKYAQASAEAEEMKRKGYTYQQETARQVGLNATKNGITGAGGGGVMGGIGDVGNMAFQFAVLDETVGMVKDAINPVLGETARMGKAVGKAAVAAAVGWDCPACGQIGNTGKCCPECGARRPEPKTDWDCPACGHTGNTGKCCIECGARRPDPKTAWDCPACGQTGNTGKCCIECGARRPEAKATWDCPACGQIGNTGKCCPECGHKKGM